jgi:hypothetical protein
VRQQAVQKRQVRLTGLTSASRANESEEHLG